MVVRQSFEENNWFGNEILHMKWKRAENNAERSSALLKLSGINEENIHSMKYHEPLDVIIVCELSHSNKTPKLVFLFICFPTLHNFQTRNGGR